MMLHRRLLGFVRLAPLPVAVAALCGLLTVACLVGHGVALATALAVLVDGGGRDDLVDAAVVAAAVAVGYVLARMARDAASAWAASMIKRRLRRQLTERLLALGPGWLSAQRAGDVHATIGDGVEALEAYVGSYLPQLFVGLTAPVVLVAGFLWLDPVVGVVVAAAAVIIPASKPVWKRVVGERGRAFWEAYRDLSVRMLESLQGMATLKLLGAAERHGHVIARDSVQLYRATRSGLATALGVYCLVATAVGAGTALAIGAGALRVERGALDALGLLVVVFVVAECFRPLMELENYWHAGFHGVAAADGIFGLIDATPPVTDSGTREPTAGPAPAVAFRDVTFTYPGAGTPAVVGVDLDIEAGQTLALVGRSGAGKSTLVALLQRWFDPDEGTVRIDGIDVRDVRLDAHRRRIAVVSQDVVLFSGTVADNLRLARPDASDADLEAAARTARILEMITALPDGWDTEVSERGTRFSGGERQRLAIARALLADAPLLVLDEATASVDGHTEAAITAAVEALSADRTTMVLAHRLSTVAHADRVVVLDAGRVVEAGPPAELLAGRGAYAHLVAAQTGGRR